MLNCTTTCAKLKRSIFNFCNAVSAGTSRPFQKFLADICFGILASRSIRLSEIAQPLQEDTKKINTIERLARHLGKGIPAICELNYMNELLDMVGDEVVIHIDNSDITKPCGKKFEGLCTVRDGSESTSAKAVFKPGYHVAEATVLTRGKNPVSLFSRIFSTKSADFSSMKAVTFDSVLQCNLYFQQATYVMDRGYDDKEIYEMMEHFGQKFVIRLNLKRRIWVDGTTGWTPLEALCDTDEFEVKAKFRHHDKEHMATLHRVKGRIFGVEQALSIIIVKGIADHPLVLATNRDIDSTDELVHIARLYFSRWRIEEYFRCKKGSFNFENFRVRSLGAINALNFCLTVCMAFLAIKAESQSMLKAEIITAARPLKDKTVFLLYRLAYGIFHILKHARVGIRNLFPPLRPNQAQLHFPGFAA